MKFWKIYFWFILIFSVLAYLAQGLPRTWEVVDILVMALAIIGLATFCWKKKVFGELFWKVFLVVFLAWNVFYQYFLPRLQEPPDLVELPQPIVATIEFITFIPLIVALFFYGFKKTELWKE